MKYNPEDVWGHSSGSRFGLFGATVFWGKLRRKKEDGTVISNQVLQTTLDGLKAISRVDFCVLEMCIRDRRKKGMALPLRHQKESSMGLTITGCW